MSIGLALFPAVEGEVEEVEKICGNQGIRKAVPLIRDDMVEKLTTAEALNSVATAQEVVITSWKEIDSSIQLKRNRLRLLVDHWTGMLRTIDELRKQESERMVRYVIAHQMQSRASVIPDGKAILDVGTFHFENCTICTVYKRTTTSTLVTIELKPELKDMANVYVDFTYDEAYERIQKTITLAKSCAERLLVCLEECKRNIVTCEVNLSQLHNYSVEIRDTLLKKAG